MASTREPRHRRPKVRSLGAELANLEKKQKYQEAIDLLHEVAARLRSRMPVA